MIFLRNILTNDQGKQKSPRENVKRYKRDQKIIATKKKNKLLMLLIIQTFSIFHTAKNFRCLQIPITFIVTQCLIFLFLSFHSFRQSLVTIKIKNKYFWESKKKRNRTMVSYTQTSTLRLYSQYICIICVYVSYICAEYLQNIYSAFSPPKTVLRI